MWAKVSQVSDVAHGSLVSFLKLEVAGQLKFDAALFFFISKLFYWPILKIIVV
jgi:hypothetical protein